MSAESTIHKSVGSAARSRRVRAPSGSARYSERFSAHNSLPLLTTSFVSIHLRTCGMGREERGTPAFFPSCTGVHCVFMFSILVVASRISLFLFSLLFRPALPTATQLWIRIRVRQLRAQHQVRRVPKNLPSMPGMQVPPDEGLPGKGLRSCPVPRVCRGAVSRLRRLLLRGAGRPKGRYHSPQVLPWKGRRAIS